MRDGRPSGASGIRATTDARARIEELFALHSTEINTYLARMVRDPELAADLTQDTFVRAFRALDTLDDPDRARPWLYRIANNVALDELRRRRIARFVPARARASSRRPNRMSVTITTAVSK